VLEALLCSALRFCCPNRTSGREEKGPSRALTCCTSSLFDLATLRRCGPRPASSSRAAAVGCWIKAVGRQLRCRAEPGGV
jgi:hypothetical protein